jgi:hypothetical protein
MIELRNKIAMTKDVTHEDLLDMVHPSQLEEKFGGEADNLTEFWPPRAISDEYGHDHEHFPLGESSCDSGENEQELYSCHLNTHVKDLNAKSPTRKHTKNGTRLEDVHIEGK